MVILLIGASLFFLQTKRVRVLLSLVERTYKAAPYAFQRRRRKRGLGNPLLRELAIEGYAPVTMRLRWIPKNTTALQEQKARAHSNQPLAPGVLE